LKSESQRYLGLLEQRLSLLEALSKTLAASRADFVAMDLESIQARIQEQERFCTEIRALDNHITNAQVRCATAAGLPPRANEIFWPDTLNSDARIDERIRGAMQRVAVAQTELKRLNDAHQAMLRRTRRTVGVLLNFFHAHGPSYAVPPSVQAGTLCEERV
jgi:hypothetical protein